MVRLIVAVTWEKECKRIAAALNAHADFLVVGAAEDCYQALHLVESEQPDIIILDYHLGSIKGWELVPVIKRKAPCISVIIISPYDDEGRAWDALLKGVSGYLIRKFDIDLLANIIHIVHKGGWYISHRILAQVLLKLHDYQKCYQKIASPKKGGLSGRLEKSIEFSPTERRIIGFINQGRSTKEIAETLNLKNGTVRNYISNLMRKTGDHSRAQMILSFLGGRP
jgi:DNA-binding NarL/FixJ family response regulator